MASTEPITIESFLEAAWNESFKTRKGPDLRFTNRVDRMMERLAEDLVYLALSIESRPDLLESYPQALFRIFRNKPDWFTVKASLRVQTALRTLVPLEIWLIVKPHLRE